jgi:hypothetical protein
MSTSEQVSIIILVISTKPRYRVVYDDLKLQWLRYVNSSSSIKVFFLTLDNIQEDYIIDGNDFVMKGVESYTPGIYEKTILGMKILLNLPEYSNIKYVIRTNISSFWIFDRLLKFLEDKPLIDYCSTGHIMQKFDVFSPHGSNMIFSKDVALKFSNEVEHDKKHSYPDDIVIGFLCRKYNIEIKKYDWCVSTHIINPDDYLGFINNISEDVITVRNNILDPKLRDMYEPTKYKMLVDHYYFSD